MNEEIRIPDRDLPTGRLQQRKEHLVNELRAWDRTERRRRRRLVLVLVPAAIAILAVTGFTTYALTREPTHLETVGCYDKAALDADLAVVNADGRDPTEICAEVWQRDGLSEAALPSRLAACVLENGAIGVFPSSGTATCGELGLAELPASYAVEGKRFAALRDAIVDVLGEPASGSSKGSSNCVGEHDARAVVRRELDARGYDEWKIEIGADGFTAERPCAEVAFDGGRKVVTIIPVWDD